MKKSLKKRVVSELQEYVVIAAYLCVLLTVFSLHRQLLLGHGISLWQQGFAIVNALIFGKIILLGQALKLGTAREGQPVAWTVLRKSLMFAVLLVVSQLLEDSLRAWFQNRPFALVVADLGGLPGILCHVAIFFVSLTPFFAVQEAGLVLGARALWDFFFHADGRRFRLTEN